MKFLNIFVSILLLIGAAGAVVELSGTDPAVFDQPGMAKEGLRTMIAAEVWGTPTGWNDASDGAPAVEGRTILSLGLVHYDRIGILNSEDIIETEEVLNTSVNNTLNATLNETEVI